VSTDTVPSDTGTTSSSFNRIAAVSGIVFIACILLSMVLVGSMPTASDDAAKLIEYITNNPRPHKVGLLVIGFGIVPAVLFLAGLVGNPRRHDQRHGEQWDTAVAAFFVVAIALLAVGVMIDAGLMLSKNAGLSDSVLLALWDISIASGGLMTLAFGGAAASTGIPVIMYGTRPAWYGWLGVLVGVFGVLGLLVTVSERDIAVAAGLPVFLLFSIWVIAGSVLMWKDT
jgi:hypothetical protein